MKLVVLDYVLPHCEYCEYAGGNTSKVDADWVSSSCEGMQCSSAVLGLLGIKMIYARVVLSSWNRYY